MDADEKQFAVIYPKFKDQGEKCAMLLTGEIDKKLPPELPSSNENREKLAKRQANAAVALLRMNKAEKVWPLLRRSDEPEDPRLRSYVIHRLSLLGADVGAIIKRLDEEPDVTIRRALVLSLGEFNEHEPSPETRKVLVPKLQTLYRSEADPGLHAAVEWLLRLWKEEPWLRRVNDEWAKDREQRDKRLASIQQFLRTDKEKTPPQWYVNGQSQTMVVIPGPVEFLMGSPPSEENRNHLEIQHRRGIGQTFAIATKEVTVEQYRRFDSRFDHNQMHRSPRPDCPILGLTWYAATAYCNWLSKQEGLPETEWCYLPNKDGKYANGMQLASEWQRRTGYRLPTEAEWEYACRAGQ
jgi:hypothetical protein